MNFKKHLQGLIACVLSVLVVMNGAGAAQAAAPAPIGDDGDYRHLRHWDTKYQTSTPTGATLKFYAGTTSQFGPDGSLYLAAIQGPSGWDSQLIQRYDLETGNLLGSTYLPTSAGDGYVYPAGFEVEPDGSMWILGPDADVQVLAHVSASGAVLSRVALPMLQSPFGFLRGPNGRFYTLEQSENSLVSFNADGSGVQLVPVPAVSGAVQQRIMVTSDNKLMWSDPDGVYTASLDLTNIQHHALQPDIDVSQATIGADGHLYVTDQRGRVWQFDPADLAASGEPIVEGGADTGIPTESYAPLGVMSARGVTADEEGVVYGFGWYYGISDESQTGVVALREVNSPDVAAVQPVAARACQALATPKLKTTGVPAVSWFEAVGDLPKGLKLDQETGVLSGTSTESGTFTVKIQAMNGVSPTAATRTVDTATVTINVKRGEYTKTAARVSGIMKTGQQLTADVAGWSPALAPAGTKYQWLRDNEPIAQATGASYTLVGADTGHRISVQVRAAETDCLASASATSASRLLAAVPSPTEPTESATDDAPTHSTNPHSTSQPTVGEQLPSTGSSVGITTLLVLFGLFGVGALALTAGLLRRKSQSGPGDRTH